MCIGKIDKVTFGEAKKLNFQLYCRGCSQNLQLWVLCFLTCVHAVIVDFSNYCYYLIIPSSNLVVLNTYFLYIMMCVSLTIGIGDHLFQFYIQQYMDTRHYNFPSRETQLQLAINSLIKLFYLVINIELTIYLLPIYTVIPFSPLVYGLLSSCIILSSSQIVFLGYPKNN